MSDAPILPVEKGAIGDSGSETYPVPDDLLRGIVDKVVRDTQATGAAIAVGTAQKMICRATAGEYFSQVGSRVNTVSGLTGLCASSGMAQTCMNTLLDDRVDAEACRELGIGSIVVVPLFYQERLLGLVGMYSSRPYAFGNRDFTALEALREEFSARLSSRAEAAAASAAAARQSFLFSATKLNAPDDGNSLIAGIKKFGHSILRGARIFRIEPADQEGDKIWLRSRNQQTLNRKP
jgi:GAF domain-containing protein